MSLLRSTSPASQASRNAWRWRNTAWTLAAAAMLAGGLALVMLDEEVEAFSTGLAERKNVWLEDGSSAELNAQTSMTVMSGRTERRVKLMRGEAVFAVAKDEARPFVVDTSAGVVRAAGTMFNVRAASASGRVEVTVLEGSVRVQARSGAAAEASLASGEQAWLEEAGTVSMRRLPEGAAEDVAAWRNGQVAFHDTTLREALERFAAYHVQQIVAEGRIADARLGGRYALNDLNGFLDAVERVLGGRVIREAPGVLRVVARDEARETGP